MTVNSSARIADIGEAIGAVRSRIAEACARVNRDPRDVRLIAATKLVASERVAAAAAAGLTDFGENYVQELEEKRGAAPDATWHFIGRLQRNKVARLLESADVVQTLEPGAATDLLERLAAEKPSPTFCLVEVDFTGRRVGVAPDSLRWFLEEIAHRPGLRVTGLMTLPPLGEDPRPYFARLRELREDAAEVAPDVRELSMGMTSDYEVAIEEGATMIRVGTAIFGPRP
ncbi:MAG: YggS family pyridoxal phosphate-dependent enzyme [Actinomycetota bacterium]